MQRNGKVVRAVGVVVVLSAVTIFGTFSAKATPPFNIAFVPVGRATVAKFDVKRKDKALDFEIRMEAPQAIDVATQIVTFQPGGEQRVAHASGAGDLHGKNRHVDRVRG